MLCRQQQLPVSVIRICVDRKLTTRNVGLCQSHCIIMYVYIGEVADAGGVLTFYLPAVVEDDS